MTNNKGSDDEALWRAVVKDVKPLKPKEPATFREDQAAIDAVPEVKKAKTRLSYVAPKGDAPIVRADSRGEKSRDVDAGTMRKLRAGQIAIDGRLDLHGMNQGEARQALIRCLVAAQASGKRCVLVITGKGKSGKRSDEYRDSAPGVLKQKVPDWLNEAPLRDIVLTAQAALPRHGGGGALYVYLRRDRSDYI